MAERGFSGTIYLLPGLGADRRMFAAQLRAFPNLRVIEWERPRAGESVARYAARLARRIPPAPFVIGGVSVGGLIAQEIAAIRPPCALVLIASLRTSHEIFAPMRLGKHFPEFAFEVTTWISQRFGSPAAPLYGSRGDQTRLLVRMLSDSDPRFLSWARRAVLDGKHRRCAASRPSASTARAIC